MSGFVRIAPAIVLAPLLAACASAQAKGSNDKPALDVPPPPPHVVELPAEPLEPVGEVTTVPLGPPPGASRPARPAPKPEAPKGTDAKPGAETKPDTSPPPPETPPAPAVAPSPQLRTPQTADTSTVRTTIDRARNTLNTVNFGPLSNERKKAYNDAKLFLQQAEDALKEGNTVLALATANKAETLARELAGR